MRIPIDPGFPDTYFDSDTGLLVRSGIVKLGGVVASTSVAFADVTGLVVPLLANLDYIIDGWLVFQSAATTTGLALSFTSPAGCSSLMDLITVGNIATVVQFRMANADDVATATGVVPAATTDTLLRFYAYVRNGANAGNWQLRFATEVAGSQIAIQPKSFLRYGLIQ